jgi:hypothetical protein
MMKSRTGARPPPPPRYSLATSLEYDQSAHFSSISSSSIRAPVPERYDAPPPCLRRAWACCPHGPTINLWPASRFRRGGAPPRIPT